MRFRSCSLPLSLVLTLPPFLLSLSSTFSLNLSHDLFFFFPPDISRTHSLSSKLSSFSSFPLFSLFIYPEVAPPLSLISSLTYFPFSAKLDLHSFISESSSFSHPSSHSRHTIPLNFSLIIILLSSLSLRPHVFSVIALLSSIPSLPPNSLFFPLHFNLSFYRPLFRLSRNRDFSLSCIFFLSLSLSHGLSHFLTSSPFFTPSTTTSTHLASLSSSALLSLPFLRQALSPVLL